MSTTGFTNLDASFRGSRGFFADIDRDLLAGIRAWPLWTMLGWNDIRQRYRRSVLGPFWITISMAVFITLLGVIYSHIFKIELKTYLPYLALGYIIWGFIATDHRRELRYRSRKANASSGRSGSPTRFTCSAWYGGISSFSSTPSSSFIPVAIIFDVRPGFIGLLALPGLALVYINQAWLTLSLAIICTRYRDVQQIVSTAIQIMLFATPIMWPVSALGPAVIIAYINPLYHMMELVRAPMLGNVPIALSWLVAIACAIVGWTIAMLLLRRASRRLVFWL